MLKKPYFFLPPLETSSTSFVLLAGFHQTTESIYRLG